MQLFFSLMDMSHFSYFPENWYLSYRNVPVLKELLRLIQPLKLVVHSNVALVTSRAQRRIQTDSSRCLEHVQAVTMFASTVNTKLT